MARMANGMERVVVDFTTGNDGNCGIQQRDERSQDSALGLAAKTQEDEVMFREDGINDLRCDRVFETDDAGKYGFPRIQLAQQVGAHLVLDADTAKMGILQFAQRLWFLHLVRPDLL